MPTSSGGGRFRGSHTRSLPASNPSPSQRRARRTRPMKWIGPNLCGSPKPKPDRGSRTPAAPAVSATTRVCLLHQTRGGLAPGWQRETRAESWRESRTQAGTSVVDTTGRPLHLRRRRRAEALLVACRCVLVLAAPWSNRTATQGCHPHSEFVTGDGPPDTPTRREHSRHPSPTEGHVEHLRRRSTHVDGRRQSEGLPAGRCRSRTTTWSASEGAVNFDHPASDTT